MAKVKRQLSYEKARALFDYRDGNFFWRKMESGRRSDLCAWHVDRNSRKKVVRIGRIVYQLHYLIWNWHFGPTDFYVSFADGDSLNTKIENLYQVPASIAHTKKVHRLVPMADILPPRPKLIAGKIELTDLRMECPCCGQTVPNVPANIIAINVGMTPMERKIFERVWLGAGEPVMAEKLFDAMYADDPDGGPTPTRMYSTLKESLCSLRKKLEGHGVGIETVGYRSGWRLVLGLKSEGK